jgi:hypothetical protein
VISLYHTDEKQIQPKNLPRPDAISMGNKKANRLKLAFFFSDQRPD